MGALMDYLDPLLFVVTGLSLPVKIAWGVWLAWGLAQLAWYYWPAQSTPTYARTPVPPARDSSVRPVAVRPSSIKKPAPASVAPYGTSDFIAALDQEQAELAAQGQPGSPSAYR